MMFIQLDKDQFLLTCLSSFHLYILKNDPALTFHRCVFVSRESREI